MDTKQWGKKRIFVNSLTGQWGGWPSSNLPPGWCKAWCKATALSTHPWSVTGAMGIGQSPLAGGWRHCLPPLLSVAKGAREIISAAVGTWVIKRPWEYGASVCDRNPCWAGCHRLKASVSPASSFPFFLMFFRPIWSLKGVCSSFNWPLNKYWYFCLTCGFGIHSRFGGQSKRI